MLMENELKTEINKREREQGKKCKKVQKKKKKDNLTNRETDRHKERQYLSSS
jgi:hypothetical protein